MSEHPDYEAIRTPEQADEKIQEAHQTLEALVREHATVKDEKTDAMKRFNTEITEIEKRMEGQLRVLEALRDRRNYVEKQGVLPFETPAAGSGTVVKAQDGSVHAGEEMFDTAGKPLKGEGDDETGTSNVVPLRAEEPSPECPRCVEHCPPGADRPCVASDGHALPCPFLDEAAGESGSSAPMMTDGMEHPAEEEPAEESPQLDDTEIEMLKQGDVDGARSAYVVRTSVSEAVAQEEIKAWQAAQQAPAEPEAKPRRGRKAKG